MLKVLAFFRRINTYPHFKRYERAIVKCGNYIYRANGAAVISMMQKNEVAVQYTHCTLRLFLSSVSTAGRYPNIYDTDRCREFAG